MNLPDNSYWVKKMKLIKSHKGKNLSKDLKTKAKAKAEAEERLVEVEMFIIQQWINFNSWRSGRKTC